MDSAICALLAVTAYRQSTALFFDYGQPHRAREGEAAKKIARMLALDLQTVDLRAAVSGMAASGLLAGVRDHSPSQKGPSAAVVPLRNTVMLTLAAAHMVSWLTAPVPIDLLLGATLEDQGGFPDCRKKTSDHTTGTLTLAAGRPVRVLSPLSLMPKAEAVTAAWTHSMGPRLIEASWSCYRGGRAPCHTCPACVFRERALATASG
jgi:7-cyano-7-deazaguanine synthase